MATTVINVFASLLGGALLAELSHLFASCFKFSPRGNFLFETLFLTAPCAIIFFHGEVLRPDHEGFIPIFIFVGYIACYLVVGLIPYLRWRKEMAPNA